MTYGQVLLKIPIRFNWSSNINTRNEH